LNAALPAPTSFSLANGLTVLQHVRPGLPIQNVALVFRTGSEANPPDRPGLANYMTAVLDQGTTSRNATQIADALAQIGASLEATSTKDAMSVSIGSLTRNFGTALDLLADVSLRPTFPEAEVERQRQSRLASLAAARQSASTVASVNAVKALFGPEHTYGYIELGSEAAARAATRDDLANFWKAHFVPGNAALVVTGPMTEADLRPLVERTFGAWAGGPAPAASLGTARPASARIIISDRPGAPQTQLAVAGYGVARTTPDYPAVSVMDTILGGLFSSRINLNLREQHGYTYGARSEFIYRKQPGIFWVTTGVRTDATAPAVTEILKEVRRMSAEAVTADELTMARDALVRTLPSAFETGAGTVGTLGELFVYGLGKDYYAKYPASIGAVTGEAVRSAAAKYLNADRLKVIAVGDRSTIEPALRRLNLGSIEIRDADGNVVR
jgi:zinc protease